MLNHRRSKRLGPIKENYKIILGLLVIAGLSLSIASCGLFGPKPETPPPPPALKEEPPPAPAEKKEEPKPEVAPAPPPAPVEIYVVTLKSNVNVRQEPTTQSKVITTLKKGTKIEKMGQTGNWVNVKLPSGEMGWIFHELVEEAK